MRRILSYLVLLMLFATSGYASIPLTTAQWTGGGSPQHVLFKSTDTAYGLQTPNANQYADLSGYSKLVVTVPEGSPRAFFNATGTTEGERLTNPYMTKNGNTFTYDLEAIVAENGFAHLNSIKAAASWVELTVSSIQLVEKSENARSWDFTASNSTSGLTITHDGTASNWVYINGTGYTVQRGVDVVITIPNVTGGNIINFDLISSGGHNSNKAWSIKCNGQELIQGGNGANVGSKSATVPNTVTTPTTAIITLKGYSTNDYLGISKLEVKAPSIYFTDLKIDGENDEGANPYIDDFRNNVLSVPYSDIGKTTEFKFQLKDANGTVITNASPNDFTITSTDGNVINVNNVPITGPNSDGEYTISGIGLQQQGTAYIKITYGGITETHPINIKKKPVYIRAGGGAAFTKNLGDADWQILFHLCEEGSTTAISLDNENYYSTSGFKNNTGAVTNTATNLHNGSLNKWFHAANIGNDVYVVRLRNHPLYEDCDAEFAFTVLKRKQDISYPQDWTFSYTEANNYDLRSDVHNDLNTGSHTDINTSVSPWIYTPSGKAITFKSSDENVLTVNSNTGKITWTGNAGTATITATVAGDDTWAPAEASFTVTINGNTAGPRIIWVTGFKGASNNGVPANNENLDMARGANYGYRWFKTDNTGTDLEGNEIIIQHEQNNIIPYNQDQWFQAVAIKAGTTNEQLRNAGLLQYPYKNKDTDDYFYYIGDDGWRYNKAPLASYLYNDSYDESAKIIYTVDVETSPAKTFWKDNPSPYANVYDKGIGSLQPKGGQVGYGAKLHIGSTYGDSLTITATYPGIGDVNPGVSSTKVWVNSSDFGFSFQPEEGVVNKDHWIIPYVKFPDLQLVDFEKIWVTIDNETAVSVEGAADMFSLSKVINPSTGQPYPNTDAAIDGIKACYSETDLRRMLGGYFDYFKLKHDETLGWMIEGIYPKIWGLTIGEEADVTIHIVGSTYNGVQKFTSAEATYHVTVVGVGDDLFHWEMNDKKDNPSDPKGNDDKQIKTIYMVEGDFIYMPGIVGNPNGNDDYSKQGSYKYVYGIQEGDIVMNFKPYFWREGIANYFFTQGYSSGAPNYSGYAPSGDPLIPETHTNVANAPEALIFWCSGLGGYYRNDSLMIYANKPCPQGLYLWAADPQTGETCTPIELKILPKSEIENQRIGIMAGMSYPFTWDFEHMDVSDLDAIAQDAKNGGNGNGGTYWRKRWDSSGGSTLRSPHGTNKDYYQWNGVFNADYDDKDNNYFQSGYDEEGKIVSGNRQRWFKDLVANGKYLDMFKGLKISIAGLEYWEQKYTRFNVSTKPDGGIFFEGGVHYMSLPGFGITGNAIIKDGTRKLGSLIMPKNHIHYNTNDYNCLTDYFTTTSDVNEATGTGGYHYNPNIKTGENGELDVRNRTVYFVIRAKGNSTNSTIDLGGKSMMIRTNDLSRTDGIGTGSEIGENGTVFSHPSDDQATYTNQNGTSTGITNPALRIKLTTEPKVYYIPMDPWDEDFQEQIYLAMNSGVHIYWMAISTEPRYLRDDYECYAYSYPKDLDMEKTNGMMESLTTDLFGQNNAVTMNAYYGNGYSHGDKALTLQDVMSLGSQTVNSNYKIAANEGLMVYPSKRLHDINQSSKLEAVTVKDKTVIKAVVDENNKPVMKDGKYMFETKTFDYTYHRLPTFYIANAENMSATNYEDNKVDGNGVGRGKATTLNELQPVENAVVQKDVNGRTIPTYNATNRLIPSTYSTYIHKDYYSQDGTMPAYGATTSSSDGYHWIPLGITNEYNKRYLQFNDDEDTYKILQGYMTGLSQDGAALEEEPNGSWDYENTVHTYYYDLIGPGVVRFYRAGNNNYMKGRRSYITLTWQEYQVNTFGKGIDGASTGNETGSNSGVVDPDTPGSYPDSGTNESTEPTSDGSGKGPGMESDVKGVRILFFGNNNNGEDELFVSEDGGFLDGIQEVEKVAIDGAFYNLNGTRVTTPRKGVYIYNGRKVIIR